MSNLDLSQVNDQDQQEAPPSVPIDQNALCHKLTVLYNPETQLVQAFDFKNSSDENPEFKSWQFVMAILGMAQKAAEALHQQQQMQAMMRMQQEQQAALQLSQELQRRNGRRA